MLGGVYGIQPHHGDGPERDFLRTINQFITKRYHKVTPNDLRLDFEAQIIHCAPSINPNGEISRPSKPDGYVA